MSQVLPERVTFTPSEFAAVFGKERTWAYRQLYAGKVKAISEYGRIQIPQSEVDRLLQEAGRYLGGDSRTLQVAKTQIIQSTKSYENNSGNNKSDLASKRISHYRGKKTKRKSVIDRLIKPSKQSLKSMPSHQG